MAIRHLERIEELLRESKEALSVNKLQELSGFNWHTIKDSLFYLESQDKVVCDDDGLWKPKRRTK